MDVFLLERPSPTWANLKIVAVNVHIHARTLASPAKAAVP